MRHPIKVGQQHGVPQVILKVFIIMLYENVFQNPQLFPTQVSLYPEQSTLKLILLSTKGDNNFAHCNFSCLHHGFG
jgi:hypothetical protein